MQVGWLGVLLFDAQVEELNPKAVEGFSPTIAQCLVSKMVFTQV